MIAIVRALSWSYFRRHPLQMALTVTGVAVGVATFASVLAARQTLVGGLASIIDRIAGRAHVQVTGVGGVPETVLDRLLELDAIEAVAPAIEQVVSLQRDGSALLVMGVDLLADRRMRDYAFDGPDADWDDPIEFLAQPDSVAVPAAWAAQHGLSVGEGVEIASGAVTRRLVVRALLHGQGLADAFGGQVAITDVYAAQVLFGRERRFDRIDIRLADGVGIDEGAAAVRAAVPGYTVETPARRSAGMSRLIGAFVGSFDVSSGLAVLVGVFLVASVLRIAVDRRRRPIGVLRALGATPRQVRGVVFGEAAAIGAVGSVIGVVVGWTLTRRFLELMSDAVQVTYGVGDEAPVRLSADVLLTAVAVGVTASLAGAWFPARLAARVDPVEALAGGAYRRRGPVTSPAVLATGVGMLCLAAAMPLLTGLGSRVLLMAAVVAGALATMCLAGPVTGRLVRLLSPLLYGLAPVAGRVAADALGGQPRRTAAATAAIALALSLVLGTGGYLHSFRTAFGLWLDDSVTADLIVRASTSLAPSAQRLPATVGTRLLNVPDVERADAYRVDWVEVNGETAMLTTIDADGFFRRTRQRITDGDHTDVGDVVRGSSVAVSENFARRYGVRRGDTIEIDTPGGRARFPVAFVLDSYLSDRGMVMLDRRTFLRHWTDDSVSAYHVVLKPGAEPDAVVAAIHQAMSEGPPVLVSTRAQFRKQALSALDGFYALTRATVGLMLAVALVGIVTSLLSGVVDRRGDLGLLKALGATPSQIRRSVVAEALLMASSGLLLAIPLGAWLARFLETVVADTYAGFIIPGTYPVDLLAWLAVAVPAFSAVAAWLPAQQAARLAAVETIRHE
jgi:putative ABC transport system permease protein